MKKNTHKIQISFLIVNWNGGEVFKKNLLSIIDLCNNYKNIEYEIIVIDNNSTDLDKKFLSAIPNLELVENDINLKFSEGTNQSVKHSRGEIIFILNNDTVIKKCDLNLVLKLLDNKNIHAIIPKLLNLDNSIQRNITRIPNTADIFLSSLGIDKFFGSSWYATKFNYQEEQVLPFGYNPMFSAIVMPKTTWQKVGNLDKSLPLLWNDVDWFYRFYENDFKALFVPAIEISHLHGHSVNKNRFKKIYYSTTSLMYFLNKINYNKSLSKIIIFAACSLSIFPRVVREILIILRTILLPDKTTN